MDENKLSLIFSVDVVFDNAFNLNKKDGKENLKFLSEISKILHESLSNYCKPKISWLVSDNELLLKEFCKVKDSFVSKYDEIGMHCLIPNFINLRNCKKKVVEKYIENSINLFNNFSLKPISNRTMGCTASNDLISVLAEFGFKVDSSSIPNRKRTRQIEFDWSDTPTNPYYPSLSDYRISGKGNSDSQKILEVPLSTILTKTSYDKLPVSRYLDLCFNHKIISKYLKDVISRNHYLVTIIHPHELLQKPKKLDLYAKSILDFSDNVKTMIKIFEELNKNIECYTLSETPKLVNNSTN